MDLARRRSELIAELEPFSDHHERFQYVIDRAKSAPALPAELKLEAFLIEGCTSNLWLVPSLDDGVCRFRCDADSLITKGVASLVCEFYDGASPAEVAAQLRKLERGQSILDAVGSQAKDLQRGVTARDRDRLDQYFTSVRDLEQRMQMSRAWEHTPRPVVHVPEPLDPASPKAYMEKVKLMYDMARLAFETDSTRSISLLLDSVSSPAIEFGEHKLSDGYHNLSHHGKSEAKLSQLKTVDEWHMKLLAELFTELKSIKEDGEPLLDRTMILYGSNLGNANTHVTTNLPTLFAGGGFRHGQHLGFDKEHNYPLPNLFVSMLQRLGIETDRFASATGTMRGLDLV